MRGHGLSLPTYCEVPLDVVEDGYAKIRTNAVDSEGLADFLCDAAARRLSFKATAGLHHAIRGEMHGFPERVRWGDAFAWFGMDRATLFRLLNETNPRGFCVWGRRAAVGGNSRASTDEVKSRSPGFCA